VKALSGMLQMKPSIGWTLRGKLDLFDYPIEIKVILVQIIRQREKTSQKHQKILLKALISFPGMSKKQRVTGLQLTKSQVDFH
jgi:hypothetical protein